LKIHLWIKIRLVDTPVIKIRLVDTPVNKDKACRYNYG